MKKSSKQTSLGGCTLAHYISILSSISIKGELHNGVVEMSSAPLLLESRAFTVFHSLYLAGSQISAGRFLQTERLQFTSILLPTQLGCTIRSTALRSWEPDDSIRSTAGVSALTQPFAKTPCKFQERLFHGPIGDGSVVEDFFCRKNSGMCFQFVS